MKTIPIGKAFSAMLWVLEKEQATLESEMIGAWNFYDQKSVLKPINYARLVNTLGYDYFDGSLYQGNAESINLTNAVDGGMLLTPENELVCKTKDESLGEGVEAWLSYEIESQISRLAHTDIYPKDEVFSPNLKRKKLDTDIEGFDTSFLQQLNHPDASKIIKNKKKSD
jgi:hypothetical protein